MLFWITLACSGTRKLEVVVAPEHEAVFAEAIGTLEGDKISLSTDKDPVGAAMSGGGIRIAVVDDLSEDCTECYRIDEEKRRVFTVHGSDLLGMQYGLADAMEQLGFRFFHPFRTHEPRRMRPGDLTETGQVVVPEMSLRGLHMHTLHPTEGYYDFWDPDEGGLQRATQVMDWVVRNRGNHIQWVGLDDVQRDPERYDEWKSHTEAIIERAHARGLTVGLGVQLFGSGNLQQAMDLVDNADLPPDDLEGEIRDGIDEIFGQLDFDLMNLSFGEFFGEDPEALVDAISLVSQVMTDDYPEVHLSSVIHVGNFEDLHVEYDGEEMLYYFLATKAEPPVEPWVHSVMYYNLFEDAGGAYLHDEFDEHRAYLLEALAAGEQVTYFPESSYWVAFDVNVPTYLPNYIDSRFVDMDELRTIAEAEGHGALDRHVLFSSGWEWGYWQNDYAVLRMNHTLPSDTSKIYEEMFAPFDDGDEIAGIVDEAASVLNEGLLQKRLAAYLAGREAVIDAGDKIGIVSQPDRPSFAEIVAWSEQERGDFEDSVLAELDSLAAALDGLCERAEGLDTEDPFVAEIRDGLCVNAARTHFSHAIFSGVVAHAAGGDADTWLSEAEVYLSVGQEIVARRHGSLHDPVGDRLVTDAHNATIYHHGYLRYADDLCFWKRERVKLSNLVTGQVSAVPTCVF